MADPLRKRLLFVTGKGGVGKSTVATAIGLVAAQRGKRTIVAEVAGREHVAQPRHHDPFPATAVERHVGERLWTISIDPQAAMEEYLNDQLPVKALADLLGSSRMFQYLAAATPGMRELLSVGKLWELAQPQRRKASARPYDLVVVDAPATGHGLGLLRAPRTFAGVARVGPVARHARTIAGTLSDPAVTGVIAVARAEEIPVTETLALQRELREKLGLELDAIVVNALTPRRYGPREAAALSRALGGADANGKVDTVTRQALHAALGDHTRSLGEQAQVRRLRAGSGIPPARLPALGADCSVWPDGCNELAQVLERAL